MERVLISACLVGRPVRYNGTAKACADAAVIERWKEERRLVPLCPELAVGFSTPRPPAEIRSESAEADGSDVLGQRARILENIGRDVSDLYVQAAHDTVEFARRYGCRHAVLTDGSPSCGSTFIYDGSFSGSTKAGAGATTAALRKAGIIVWPETAVLELDAVLRG